jgi:hypothetical protein
MGKLARVLVSTLLVAGAVSPAVRAAEGTGTVVGTVIDAGRKPLSSIGVRATDVVDPSRVFTTSSDKDGRFTINNVPTGSYLISADTVNTTWIQKDDSPIVEVSGTARPNVVLALVRTTELQPNAIGDGNGGVSGIQMATLAVATLATVGVIVTAVDVNNLEDDNDRLSRENLALQRQLQDTLQQLTEQDIQLNRQLNELSDQNSAEAQALRDEIAAVRRELERVQRQLDRLGDLIDRLRLSSPFR